MILYSTVLHVTLNQVRMATGRIVTEPALSLVTNVTRSAGRSSARTRGAAVWTRSWTGVRRTRSAASTASRAARASVWGRTSSATTPAATAPSTAGARTQPSVSLSRRNQKRWVVYCLDKMS